MLKFRVENRQFLGELKILRRNGNFESKFGHFEQRLTERLKKGLLSFESNTLIRVKNLHFKREFTILSENDNFESKNLNLGENFLHFIGFNSSNSDLTRLALLARLEQLGSPLRDHLHFGTT